MIDSRRSARALACWCIAICAATISAQEEPARELSAASATSTSPIADDPAPFVDSLLAAMTLADKVGQLNHLKGDYSTDIYEQSTDLDSAIAAGAVGAVTPRAPMSRLRAWQRRAVEASPRGIPLLFSADIVHGYRTLFPIPLAQSCSWDLPGIRRAEEIAAREATANGITWTFAPMVDVSHDARWGRYMETAGEDVTLAGAIGAARVRGFQGASLAADSTLLACAKHFAGYGAVEGGRDYNEVDLSERRLRARHLPPFRAALEAGVATVMNSFTTVNGIPASANRWLLRTVLREEWGFRGFTVSDANSFYELIPHGVAADRVDAAQQCFAAGADTDLWGEIYAGALAELVRAGRFEEAAVDTSVRRVLMAKARLGLFDDPYRYLDTARARAHTYTPAHRRAARSLAAASMVLLKNDDEVLPLAPGVRAAVVGPLVDSRDTRDMVGNWGGFVDMADLTTPRQALEAEPGLREGLTIVDGCGDWGRCSDEQIAEAVAAAASAEVALLFLGEHGYHTGESGSRLDVSLPGNQEELVRAVAATGTPVVLLVAAGRPLVLTEVLPYADAVLMIWQPGTEAGPAIADVLTGRVNPGGKLTATLPYANAQVPLHYAQRPTGRPKAGEDDERWGVTSYGDAPNGGLFPFGFGLSYTTFALGTPQLSATVLHRGDSLRVGVEVANTGSRAGSEVVQLYLRDPVASASRPLRELVAFRKVTLGPGERRRVDFALTEEDLAFYDIDLDWRAEAGAFEVYLGNDSTAPLAGTFRLVDGER